MSQVAAKTNCFQEYQLEILFVMYSQVAEKTEGNYVDWSAVIRSVDALGVLLGYATPRDFTARADFVQYLTDKHGLVA